MLPARWATDFRNDSINALVSYELEALDAYMELATALVVRELPRWRELGHRAVAGELASLVRPATRRASDVTSALKRAIPVWSRFFSFGAWRVGGAPDGRVSLHIAEFDPASQPLRLWLVGVIESTAQRAVAPELKVSITLGEMGFTPELACDLA
jgi:serine/threonine-protein kinase